MGATAAFRESMRLRVPSRLNLKRGAGGLGPLLPVVFLGADQVVAALPQDDFVVSCLLCSGSTVTSGLAS